MARGACARGRAIGYDPWLHTRDWVKKAKEALASRGAELVAVDSNPIDEIWTDRPEASKAHLVVQSDQYAGKSAAEKRTEIGDWLVKHHADAAVLVGARFDRLGVQHPRRRRDPHAGRAGLCDRPCRRHRRPVRRLAKRWARRAPASRQRCPRSTSALRSERALRTQGQDRRRRSRARGRRNLRGARQGRRQDPAAARSDHPSQGAQEPGRDRRPESRAGPATARRSPASSTGSTRRRRRARSTS